MPAPEEPTAIGLLTRIVLHNTEDVCTVTADDGPIDVPFAAFFPTPRVERVMPGHLVAVTSPDTGPALVVWRWFDAVVREVRDDAVLLWEPAHGSVVARPRKATQRYRAGSRAYLSAGLPGAPWWVAGPVVDRAEHADVELAEVDRFLTSVGFGTRTA